MAEASEYLAAAAVMALRGEKRADVPRDRAGLSLLMQQSYDVSLDQARMDSLLGQLARWKMVTADLDQFAGELLNLSGTRSDAVWEEAGSEVLDKAWEWNYTLFERTFANKVFWEQLDAQPPMPFLESQAAVDEAGPVPASDRTVTLSHNQFKAIDEPTGNLIAMLGADNGLPDEIGLRERVLGQLKAGRELIRAGTFELSLLQISLVAGLRTLMDKYGEKAIGTAASVLLTIVLHQLEIPGF